MYLSTSPPCPCSFLVAYEACIDNTPVVWNSTNLCWLAQTDCFNCFNCFNVPSFILVSHGSYLHKHTIESANKKEAFYTYKLHPWFSKARNFWYIGIKKKSGVTKYEEKIMTRIIFENVLQSEKEKRRRSMW